MIIKKMKIGDIQVAEYNPRIDLQPGDPEYEKIKKSIDEFDLVEPLIVNKRNNKLVGGHQRLKVLQVRGDTEVQVSIVDLDDAHEKALNLALNKIGGDWDQDKLSALLSELSELSDLGDLPDFDIDMTGFDLDEINDILPAGESGEDDFNVDEAIDEIEKAITQPGDLIILGRHRLLCGDATKDKDIKTLLSENKNNIIVLTDPPYGISIVDMNSNVGGGGNLGFIGACGWVDVQKFRSVIGDDSLEAIKKHYNLIKNIEAIKGYIIFGGNYFTDILCPSSCWIIWDKREGVPSNNFADCEIAWTNFNSPSRIYRHLWSGLLRKGNRDEELVSRVHPTQKPVGLFKNIINDYSKNDDSVLDCFGGSGTTLIACQQLDRTCYMMEIDPIYCDVIVKRWEALTGEQAQR